MLSSHQVTPTPPNMIAAFGEGVELFKRASFSLDTREVLQGEACEIQVVFKAESGDVVFQLFPKNLKLLGGDKKGRELLAELVEVYFTTTDHFFADWVPELKSWALKAAGLQTRLNYDKAHHVDGFATYVNQALASL